MPTSPPTPPLPLGKNKKQIISAILAASLTMPSQNSPETPAAEMQRLLQQLAHQRTNTPKLSEKTSLSEEELSTLIAERFASLRNASAQRRPKKQGDLIQIGDEVTFNMIGYTAEGLLPFSAHEEVTLILEEDTLLPTFGTALVGVAVGETATLQIPLPKDYEIESLRYQPASFVIQVLEVDELNLSSARDPEFLASLGLPPDLDDALAVLGEEILEEHNAHTEHQNIRATFDALLSLSPYTIPDEEITRRIQARWHSTEGRFLEKSDFPRQDIEESLAAWLNHPPIREHERHNAVASQLLDDLGRFFAIRLIEEDVIPYLAEEAKTEPSLLSQEASDEEQRSIQQIAWYLLQQKTLKALMDAVFVDPTTYANLRS